MQYKFHAFGHPNILATHKTTLEFTKDNEVSLNGDCIIGVNADFDLKKLKEFVKGKKKLRMAIKAGAAEDHVEFELNPDFDDEKEIVIRKGDFISKRTLGIRADKACVDLKKELIAKLTNSQQEINIRLC